MASSLRGVSTDKSSFDAPWDDDESLEAFVKNSKGKGFRDTIWRSLLSEASFRLKMTMPDGSPDHRYMGVYCSNQMQCPAIRRCMMDTMNEVKDMFGRIASSETDNTLGYTVVDTRHLVLDRIVRSIISKIDGLDVGDFFFTGIPGCSSFSKPSFGSKHSEEELKYAPYGGFEVTMAPFFKSKRQVDDLTSHLVGGGAAGGTIACLSGHSSPNFEWNRFARLIGMSDEQSEFIWEIARSAICRGPKRHTFGILQFEDTDLGRRASTLGKYAFVVHGHEMPDISRILHKAGDMKIIIYPGAPEGLRVVPSTKIGLNPYSSLKVKVHRLIAENKRADELIDRTIGHLVKGALGDKYEPFKRKYQEFLQTEWGVKPPRSRL